MEKVHSSNKPLKEKKKMSGFKRFFTRSKKEVQYTTSLQTKIVVGGRIPNPDPFPKNSEVAVKPDDTTEKSISSSSSQNSINYIGKDEREGEEDMKVNSALGDNLYCKAEDTSYVLSSLAKEDHKVPTYIKNIEDASMHSYDESIFSGESSFLTEGDIFLRMDDARLLCMPSEPLAEGNNAWKKAFADLMLQ